MRSIETVWRGKRFRSRTEARWAVYFECLCIDWEYEPEGFVLDDGTRYLPDFLLHGLASCVGGDLWVEVKGRFGSDDVHKVDLFSRHAPLYLVGDVPYREDMDQWYEVMESVCYKGPGPYLHNFETVDDDHFGAFLGVDVRGVPGLFGDDGSYLCDSWNDANMLALKTAAMSRFDHGERPDAKEIARCRRMVTKARDACVSR